MQLSDPPVVLIADDDAQVRRALRLRLAACGCRVIECADGLAAIARSRSHRVDAMILDHEMPLGQGQTIAANIRQYSDSPIIFLSGHPRRQFADTVMRLRDTYYLPKPLDGDRLLQLLRTLLGLAAPTP